MTGLYIIWHGKPSYKRILFRYNAGIKWRYIENWKFNKTGKFVNIRLPFFRFQTCNSSFEIGIGNHYLEIGW